MNSGVYEIVNTVNGKRYVGSAKSFAARWGIHRRELRANKHHNGHLQRAWNAYGESAFEFRKVLICSQANLVMYEQTAIDASAPEYNICRIAGSTLGISPSAETRSKIAKALLGGKLPADRCRKRAKLTDDQVRAIRRQRADGGFCRDIGAMFGISTQAVTRICLRERYDWVDPGEPQVRLPRAAKGRGQSGEAKASRPKKERPAPNPDARRRPKSEEQRRKISEALMGHSHNAGIPKSAEHRANLSAAKRGVPNPKLLGNKHRAGKTRGAEEMRKCSESLKATWARRKADGLTRNEQAIAKQAASLRATWARKKAAALTMEQPT